MKDSFVGTLVVFVLFCSVISFLGRVIRQKNSADRNNKIVSTERSPSSVLVSQDSEDKAQARVQLKKLHEDLDDIRSRVETGLKALNQSRAFAESQQDLNKLSEAYEEIRSKAEELKNRLESPLSRLPLFQAKSLVVALQIELALLPRPQIAVKSRNSIHLE